MELPKGSVEPYINKQTEKALSTKLFFPCGRDLEGFFLHSSLYNYLLNQQCLDKEQEGKSDISSSEEEGKDWALKNLFLSFPCGTFSKSCSLFLTTPNLRKHTRPLMPLSKYLSHGNLNTDHRKGEILNFADFSRLKISEAREQEGRGNGWNLIYISNLKMISHAISWICLLLLHRK